MVKIVALEEHLVTDSITDAWTKAQDAEVDRYAVFNGQGSEGNQLVDLGERRLADMDDQGIDVQVLSVTTPGVQNLLPHLAVPLAREANAAIAAAVDKFPERFDGFATLPTPDPRGAADELRHAVEELGLKGAMVHGRTGSRNLDHPDFEPIWATAAELRCPIYIHPQLPVTSVRDAYYSGFDDLTSYVLGGPGIGWHYETGLQLIRLLLSGAFDRHPELQVIVGHWGEVVLFYIERLEHMRDRGALRVKRPFIDYFSGNVSYTGSGDLSDRYLRWTIEVVGVDRLLYSTDYPFIDTSAGKARRFLEQADLTERDRDAIGHSNWDRLTAHLG